jgi:hypothetical protein
MRKTWINSPGRLALFLGGLSLLGGACAAHVPQPYVLPPAEPPPPALKGVPQALIHTSGVTIRSADGAFQLQAGAQAATPFSSPDCPQEPDTSNYELAIQAGARAVWVDLPGRPQPLAGILLFCDVPMSATGPASRLHLVRIPDQYVDATAGGRMSVVYEPMVARVGYEEKKVATWMLYLSENPVPGLVWSSSGSSGGANAGVYGSIPGGSAQADPHTSSPGTVGLRLESRKGQVVVSGVQPGGPAAAAGIVPGDVIVSIGSLTAAQVPLAQVAGALKGQPGSTVFVTVRRSGSGLDEVLAVQRR